MEGEIISPRKAVGETGKFYRYYRRLWRKREPRQSKHTEKKTGSHTHMHARYIISIDRANFVRVVKEKENATHAPPQRRYDGGQFAAEFLM